MRSRVHPGGCRRKGHNLTVSTRKYSHSNSETNRLSSFQTHKFLQPLFFIGALMWQRKTFKLRKGK